MSSYLSVNNLYNSCEIRLSSVYYLYKILSERGESEGIKEMEKKGENN